MNEFNKDTEFKKLGIQKGVSGLKGSDTLNLYYEENDGVKSKEDIESDGQFNESYIDEFDGQFEEEFDDESQIFSMTDLSMYPEESRQAILRTLRYLNDSEKTEGQVRRKLKDNDFGPDAIETAIEYAKAFHYIDDYRYVENFAELNLKKKSKLKVKQALLYRLVDESIIDEVLGSDEYDDNDALKKDALKLVSKYDEVTYQDKQKIMAKLYRKGYKSDAIIRVLDEILSQ
ncbi:MAG: RecX family transcriptional regulator [Lachnospiraceae bacterium]|nr:RecX family transcriptional regulator [Lachnospiraceae bacterium]